MKRTEVIRRIRQAAKDAGLEFAIEGLEDVSARLAPDAVPFVRSTPTRV